MRTTLTVLFACVSTVVAAGETQLSVTGPNGLSGEAVLLNRLLEDGRKYVRLNLELKTENGLASSVVQESTYDTDGKPVRSLQSVVALGGRKRTVVVTYDALGAKIVVDDGSKKETNVPAGLDAEVRALNEFWWVRDRPIIGDSWTYSRIHLGTLVWSKETVKYEGKADIVVAGKSVNAHKMTVTNGTVYVDDKGDPYRIESGGVVMSRKSV